MSDLNLTAELGPKYEILIEDQQVKLDNNYQLQLVTQPTLTLAVGTGNNAPVVVSDTIDVAVTTAEAVGAYRAIGYNGLYTQPTVDSLSGYAGVTKVAVSSGNTANVVRAGLMTEGGWSWTPNAPVFIGADGVLTQTPPTFGNPVRRIAWAISATQLNLDPYPIIGV